MTNPAMSRLGLVLVNASEPAVDVPLAGVYPGIPMETYHRWPGASNSRLTKIRQSPAHLKAYLDQPTDAAHFAVGRATHAALLEPRDFASRYARLPDGHGATKAVKDAKAALEATHGVGYVLKPDDYDTALAMRNAVLAHPKARRLLSGMGEVELSAIWNDEATGVLCKARMDRYSPAISGGAIVDVKTCRDASPRAFESSIYNYGYHRQAAFYLAAAKATGLNAEHFVVVAVEKEPPYAVAVYRITEGAIEAGAEQIKPLLALYAKCVETNTWPGYSENIVDIAIPNYAWSQIENEVKEGVA